MARAIMVEAPGGPERLRLAEVAVGGPGPGQILLRQHAAGVNYIDVYHRTGLYQVGHLPFTPGIEGAGVVEEVGPGVVDLRPGDRVGYAGALGGYCDLRVMAAAQVVRIPEPVAAMVSHEQVASMMLKGLTANCLLRYTVSLGRGDQVLLHAAAGGVGLIFCQWARHLGIEVIATAGGPDKCARALEAGAAHAIDYLHEDFVVRTRDLTGGKGVKAAFDSVGADTFMRSLDCLRPLGMLVSYGQSSGPPPPLEMQALSSRGSLYVTRPMITTYLADRQRYQSMAAELFQVVQSGVVKIAVRGRYALADAAQAHRDLESRRTTGSSVLIP